MNAAAGPSGPKIYYALSLGVNPLGGPTAPDVLAKMEAQLLALYNNFLNATDADARAIDGNGGADGADAKALAAAAYRHPITKKFAVVLYVEPVFEEMCKPSHNRRRAHSASQPQSCVRTGDSYVRRTPASIGHKFHVGYSDGNGWRDGLWGWMIDRSCGPPHNFTQACTETTNISAPSKIVMLSRFAATDCPSR